MVQGIVLGLRSLIVPKLRLKADQVGSKPSGILEQRFLTLSSANIFPNCFLAIPSILHPVFPVSEQ